MRWMLRQCGHHYTLEANGTLQIQIEEFGNKITGVEYKVYSLNGEETYLEGKQKDISDETILLDLKKVFRMKFQKLFWK